MKKVFYAIVVLVTLIGCAKKTDDHKVVATVNGDSITKGELVNNINYFPQLAGSKKDSDLVAFHLDLLIEKRLFAQKAKSLGYHESKEAQEIAKWVKRDEMNKALYMQEISDRVKISKKELEKAFQFGAETVHLRHIFVKTREEADQVLLAIQGGKSFQEIAAETFSDSVLKANGGDLGYLTRGELSPELADAAFNLKVGNISQPVKTEYGYHILRVDDKGKRDIKSKKDREKFREQMEKQLRLIKERQEAQNYVNEFMDQFNVELGQEGYTAFTIALQKVVTENMQNIPNYIPAFGDEEITDLEKALAAEDTAKTLFTFDGGDWTIGEFFQKIKARPFNYRPGLTSPSIFQRDMQIMIRDEFFEKEAIKRGLENDPEVLKVMQKWEEDYSFSIYWKTKLDSLSNDITDKEIDETFKNNRDKYMMPPKVHVQEILLPTQAYADSVKKLLDGGASFRQMVKKHSIRKWAVKNNGDLGWLTPGEMGNISIVAFRTQKGHMAGPIPGNQGYSIIKLLETSNRRKMSKREATELVKRDILYTKQVDLYEQLKSELLSTAELDIDREFLTEIVKELSVD